MLGSEGTSESGVAVIDGEDDGPDPSGGADGDGRFSGAIDEKLPRAAIEETGPGSGVVKWVTTRRASCHG